MEASSPGWVPVISQVYQSTKPSSASHCPLLVLTTEEEDAIVRGPLVHSIHFVQVAREAPPEACDQGRAQGGEVLALGQAPEV